MNPYADTDLSSPPCHEATSGSGPGPDPVLAPGPGEDSNFPSLSRLPVPPVIQTRHSSVLNFSPHHGSSETNREQNLVQSPDPDRSALPLPGSNSDFAFSSRSSLGQVSTESHPPASTPNPYPAPSLPTTGQVSVVLPSPESRPPLTSQCSEESCPDLECSICFSQFNNIFRCPKMLHCKHTFCLECLARINVKSAEPSAIQCPLCRSFTPLPSLGLPKLTTDSDVLSYLPAAMQRVYSIRFLRNKGKLEVKRSHEGRQHWGQRSLTSLRSVNRSLDVGLPSPPLGGRRRESRGVGGALFRLTGRPACRAFLLTSVVMMMILLTGIIIFLITYKKNS